MLLWVFCQNMRPKKDQIWGTGILKRPRSLKRDLISIPENLMIKTHLILVYFLIKLGDVSDMAEFHKSKMTAYPLFSLLELSLEGWVCIKLFNHTCNDELDSVILFSSASSVSLKNTLSVIFLIINISIQDLTAML